jgi:hypothetical protein
MTRSIGCSDCFCLLGLFWLRNCCDKRLGATPAIGAIMFGRIADMLDRKRACGLRSTRACGGCDCIRILSECLVVDRAPFHSALRDRRRLPCPFDDYEQVCRQETRALDLLGLRDAGRRPDRRPRLGGDLADDGLVARSHMASAPGVRRHSSSCGVPDAAPYGGNPVLSVGHWPAPGLQQSSHSILGQPPQPGSADPVTAPRRRSTSFAEGVGR